MLFPAYHAVKVYLFFAKFNAKGAVYKNQQQSFSTMEPSIDLTAPSFLMFAWRIASRPAVMISSRDISPAADQRSIFQRNSLWPPREIPAGIGRVRATAWGPHQTNLDLIALTVGGSLKYRAGNTNSQDQRWAIKV
jgi:hypothetical protein